ncbi:MAG: hypothetical protein NW241_15730 [Bacteroidia bacterium]|nr:hypothetical protein [Bacteroidia bacterium]
MKQVVVHILPQYYERFLKLLESLDYVSVAPAGGQAEHRLASGYDFSDLAGQLQWQGDAVRQQRMMRDEW